MAWLTTYDDTNKIVDSESERQERISYFFGTPVVYSRTITDQTYRYVGMTYAAAQTCVGALASPTVLCELVRENDAGAYTVRVNSQTIGDWAEV
jgi:hypothetical protein